MIKTECQLCLLAFFYYFCTMGAGRPTKYNPEIAELICEEISTTIKGLRTICRENKELPTYTSVKSWLRKYPEFLALYSQAKEEQADLLIEEMLAVAYDDSEDEMFLKRAGELQRVENKEFVNRSRLKVDTLKFIASKLKPKKYGDKVAVEHSGEIKDVQVFEIGGKQIKLG